MTTKTVACSLLKYFKLSKVIRFSQCVKFTKNFIFHIIQWEKPTKNLVCHPYSEMFGFILNFILYLKLLYKILNATKINGTLHNFPALQIIALLLSQYICDKAISICDVYIRINCIVLRYTLFSLADASRYNLYSIKVTISQSEFSYFYCNNRIVQQFNCTFLSP